MSMASRISRRAARRSLSRSARTLERASGTAILVSTSRMVKATISSTSVMPLRLFRFGFIGETVLLHRNRQARAGEPITRPWEFRTVTLRAESDVAPAPTAFTVMAISEPGPATPGAPGPAQLNGGQAHVVHNIARKHRLHAIPAQQVARGHVRHSQHFRVVGNLDRGGGGHIGPAIEHQRHRGAARSGNSSLAG